MSRLEYALASRLLRLLGWIFGRLPMVPDRVVLASPRISRLEGNLAFIHAELRARNPALRPVVLLDTYGYGLRAKAAYLLRTIRGMYYLRTSPLVVIDNAYLPVHVAPHGRATRVVQVWHAVSAVKRFGLDTVEPPAEPERTFLHRYYDEVVVSSERVRATYAAALRTPIDRVLALGTPRTDFFFDQAAMEAARRRLLAAHPMLAGRTGRALRPDVARSRQPEGVGRSPGPRPSARAVACPITPSCSRPIPTSIRRRCPTDGYDVVLDPRDEINDMLALTDILITDYSSAIFEFALLRRPIVLLTGDLADYARDPGVCLDFATEMIGTQVIDTDAAAAAILEGRFDLSGYDAFIERHLGACDGRASARFVDRFVTRSGRPERQPS